MAAPACADAWATPRPGPVNLAGPARFLAIHLDPETVIRWLITLLVLPID
jgi:hypothetical protein